MPWKTESRGENMLKGFVSNGHRCLYGTSHDDDTLLIVSEKIGQQLTDFNRLDSSSL